MKLKRIILSQSTWKSDEEFPQTNYDITTAKNLISFSCNCWNDIVYAFSKVQIDNNEVVDPRFYYKSIIFSLYLLGGVTKRIGKMVPSEDHNLKDLRDNIAHMDEKLKGHLGSVNINEIRPRKDNETPSMMINGNPVYGNMLVGGSTDGKNTSSPFGIIDNVVYSTMEPSNQSSDNYVASKFVAYEIDHKGLLDLEKEYIDSIKKYFEEIKIL